MLLIDDDAMHDRDLRRRPAEAQQRNTRPRPRRLGEEDAVRRRPRFLLFDCCCCRELGRQKGVTSSRGNALGKF
jgi:hypothetical protein